MLHNMTVGQALPFDAGGDFTIYKYVANLSRDEIENKVGYERGRMRYGGVIAVMSLRSLSKLQAVDFTLGASSRWSRSKAAAKWAPEFMTRSDGTMDHNAIEGKLGFEDGSNTPQNLDLIKGKIIKFFQNGGYNLPAKIFPDWKHESGMDYPSAVGPGLPQFNLNNNARWVVARVILPKSDAI